MKSFMSFRKVAFGLLLGTLPLAGSSLNAAGDAGLGAKVISGFKAAVSVDKGMVIATPGSGFDTLAVSIDFSGVFDTAAANEFVVELSDPQGSFAQNTTEIVRLTEAKDTVYGWIVPSTVADGDFYRVHVRSTLLDSVVGQSLQFRVRKEYEAEAQIPNSGFEVWQNEGMAEAEPLGWHSFKTASGTLSSMGGSQLQVSSDVRPGSAGKYSAQIRSNVIMGVPANGNLTTGRINMGSMTAADITGNYNFTDLTDPGHAMPFATVPDSLTFWVKFTMTDKLYQSTGLMQGFNVTDSSDMYAAVTVTIHDGDTAYQDPNVDSLKQGMETHVVAKAQQLIPDSKGEWVRYSLPFEPGMSQNPRYILVSVTTNINPGCGPAGTFSGMTATRVDTLWLDDMLMIYTPEVSLAVEEREISLGRESVGFEAVLSGTINPSNINGLDSNLLIVEADTLADFSSASLDTLYNQKADAGTVKADLDLSDLLPGKTYYLRARTTNYAAVSDTLSLQMLEESTEVEVVYEVEGSDEAEIRLYRNAEEESLLSGSWVGMHDSLTFIAVYPENERFLGWYENDTLQGMADTLVVGDVQRAYHLVARFEASFANEDASFFDVRLYPNPAKEELHVEGAELDRIEIFSLTGVKVLEARLDGCAGEIRLQGIPRGMYLYKVYDRFGAVVAGRLLKI